MQIFFIRICKIFSSNFVCSVVGIILSNLSIINLKQIGMGYSSKKFFSMYSDESTEEDNIYMDMTLSSVKYETGRKIQIEEDGLLSSAEKQAFSSFEKTDLLLVNLGNARGQRSVLPSLKPDLDQSEVVDSASGEFEDNIYDYPTSTRVVGLCNDEHL
jgi:hypothetical protein